MEDAFEAEEDLSASEGENGLDVSEEGKAVRQNKLREMMEDDGEIMAEQKL